MKTTKDNMLFLDGVSAEVLVEKFGTPLYVYSETEIKRRIQELRSCFLEAYEDTRVAYAAKAFLSKDFCKLLQEEGLCIDVVSGGELYTAIEAGFPPEKIEFNGNNKSLEELEMALSYGIGRIILDSEEEIKIVEALCKERGQRVSVLYRINPGVRSRDTHEYNSTATKDAKFGIPLAEEILYPAIKQGIESPYLDLLGLHFHVGSQIFENQTHLDALETALEIMTRTIKQYQYIFSELNLGGGFGIQYTEEDRRKEFSYFLTPLMNRIVSYAEEKKIPRPTVVIEPGRSIVGEAGTTLYRVGIQKEIPGIRNYLSIDGGMTDNIRPALYQAKYQADIANRMEEPKDYPVTICGKCCESGDLLLKDAYIQKAQKGDICAVYSTGAYGYSMASNYNKNRLPAVVFVKEGEARLSIKRQSYSQMIQNEV